MNPLVVQGAAQLLLGKYKTQKGMLMKNILTMAATGLVIFASLGWYLDWYKVNRTAGPDGRQHITIDVNTKRIESDIEKGRSQVTGYLNNGTVPPLTPPAGYPQSQYPPQPQQQYPPGYYPQQPTYPPNYQQQPPAQGWIPASPASRPGATPVQPYVPPPQGIPGRPF